ncbi:MAG: PQQ-dependent sugar dehydrogenase [Xanthobacteraceae bacterium]
MGKTCQTNSSQSSASQSTALPRPFLATWKAMLLLVVVVGGVTFAFGFTCGFTVHKFKYAQVQKLLRRISQRKPPDPSEVLSRQYSRDRETIPSDRRVDTGLLPARIKTVRVSDHFPIAKTGGAITTIGDVVLVLDRLGNVYASRDDGEQLEKQAFPQLPNNVEAYLRTPGAELDGRRFRAYDIEYLKLSKLLAVSHEYFDIRLGETRLAVSVIPMDDEGIRPIGTWRTVFLSEPEPNGPNEDGAGRMVEAALDKIYLTVGDYMITSPEVSQDMNSSFGKILEIDIETGSKRVVSLGHRNPEGLLKTRSGALFSTEHGPKGGDEFNSIVEGANYGWPNVSLGTEYASYDFAGNAKAGDHSGYTLPLFSWLPSIAVSNLIEVHGFDSRWDGDILVGSLKALSLFRLRLNGAKVLYSEPIWIGQRIRDLAQLKDGTIVLWTDDTQLMFVSVDREQLSANERPASQASARLNSACMYCHHTGATTSADPAPTLTGLFSRKIGSDNFRYSAGLRNLTGSWDGEKLKKFLAAPDKFANGTSMPNLDLDPKSIDEIVRDLEWYSTVAQKP